MTRIVKIPGKQAPRNMLIFQMCFSLLWLCGCPYSPEVAEAHRYRALKDDMEPAKDELRVRCSLKAAKDIVESVARASIIPYETNRRFEKIVKNFVMDETITKKDQIFLFGWYEGSGNFPAWGHLILVESVAGTDVTLIRVMRRNAQHIKHRRDSAYFFDWIAKIKYECKLKGYSVM